MPMKRPFCGIALLALLVMLSGLHCSPGEAPPNVIVILIDTLNWDALGCNGNPHNPSPHIDSLASEGVIFNQAVSTSGWTLPAVGSLLTGSWPLIHGGLGKGLALTAIRKEMPTAAEQFQEAGFNTAAYTNTVFLSPALGLDRGFAIYDHHNAFSRDIRRADETVSATLERIRRDRAKPNFIFVHLYDPHLDYHPPAGYAARFAQGLRGPEPPLIGEVCRKLAEVSGGRPPAEAIEYIKRIYLGEVAFVDAQIGHLVDELKKLGLYDAATLIVTADHGEEFWDHGGFEHGHTLYDELIRIPLIVKLPADVEAARKTIDAQVSIVDIMPTLFELQGIEQPESFIGSSLMPMIRGEELDDRPAYSESTLYGYEKVSWRGSRYKLIYDMDPDKERQVELYDLDSDPGELVDLVVKEPAVARRLEEELRTFAEALVSQSLGMSPLQPAALAPEEVDTLKSLGYIK
jgi:arylsulfatase A-like enzyme